jgi:hypothetical protein
MIAFLSLASYFKKKNLSNGQVKYVLDLKSKLQ